MRFGIRTLDELDVRGKTVLCRVDINQPVDRTKGTLKSVNRIRACVPTVRELSDKGAKVVLMAHQGSDIEYKNFYTTRPHAQSPRSGRARCCCWTTCGSWRRSRPSSR